MKVETETKPYDSINVTPMLDLAYVLLVIFIIMTTASVQGLKVSLPKPSNKPSLIQKEVRIVQILPDGALLLNGASTTMDELRKRLMAALAKDPDTSLMIKGDPQAQYEKVMEIIDMAADIRLGNVGLVTARIGT